MRQKGCLKKRTKTRVISGSGVNLEEHPPMPCPKEDTVRFVSVMRIMKDKGIEELLEAARRIMKSIRKRYSSCWAPTRKKRGTL